MVLPDLFVDLSTHSVFIAGSPEFVADCGDAARALGVAEDRLHVEGYYPCATAESPPIGRLSAVTCR